MVPPVRVSFLGGASAIGASCALVQVADRSLLIDCGVRFRTDRALPDLEQLAGKHLDAILVTHAHSDHTGGLPVVAEAFPEAPIYMTPPTRSLVEILQRDALKLMRMPAEREADIPLYGERQVEAMLGQVCPVHHDASFVVGDVRVTYLPASHILGASMVHLETPGGNVMFTGDYSVSAQRTVDALARPTLPVDWVFTESTYGNRIHADRKLAEERLLNTVGQVLEAGGRVLIPAFAIGRAQEVLLILRDGLRRGRIPRVPIFADGMVRSVCAAYPQHERYLTPALARQMRSLGHPFFGDDVRAVVDTAERRQIVSGGACVVVSSSGMLSGGPSAFYASEFASNERDAILITGYQDEESPGRALLDLASQQGPRTLTVAGKNVDVRCRFESYSLSGHADRMQMVGLLESLRPRAVGLVHGDRDAKEAMARSLGERDIVLCDDGVTLERTFLPRGRPAARRGIDRDRAEALVGLDTGLPLDPSALALAWFGHEVPAAQSDAFVRELTALGVVEPHGTHPEKLRSRIANTSRAAALLEEQLKQENPKGKLLEWCARSRAATPDLLESVDGDQYLAELVLRIDERELRAGPVKASSKKVAEQLAARELLRQLEAGPDEHADDVVRLVSPSEGERLKAKNAKGKLLELCAKYKLATPSFEPRVRPGGHLRRGLLRFPSGVRKYSTWYQADTAREAEQAASDELLDALWAWKNGTLSPPLSTTPDLSMATGVDAPVASSTREMTRAELVHPKSALNHLQQTQHIDSFGFDPVGQKGSQHALVFQVRGWLVRDGERTLGPVCEAPNKREAEALAATALLALVRSDV